MKTIAPPAESQILIQTLQADLQAEFQIPIRVQSIFREKRLVVVIEHLATAQVETEHLFEVAEAVVRSQPVLDALDDWDEQTFTGQVRIYLRIAGRQQPYALHTCQIRYLSSDRRSASQFLPLSSSVAPLPTAPTYGSAPTEPMQPVTPDPSTTAWLEKSPASTPRPEVLETSDGDEEPAQRSTRRLVLAIAGLLAGLVTLGVGTYLLSRPCVVGACTRLGNAQMLDKQLKQDIQQAKSAQDLQLIQQQIRSTSQSLQQIPSWSTHGEAAALTLQEYQNQSLVLDQLLKAFEQATLAQQRLKPPHAAHEWAEIQQFWQRAIDYLDTIAPTSSAYPLAQEKQAEYQANLLIISRSFHREKRAEAQLFRAKQGAQVAEGREALARTPGNWQLVATTWQTAVKDLKEVPPNTVPRQEADQLLANYQTRMATAQTRFSREKLMADAYSKATKLAQQADTLGKKGQWFQAVTTWKDAISNAKQVAPDSFHGPQAQSLLKPYQTQLTQAEQQFQAIERLQKLQVELKRICQNSSMKICAYSITSDRITVQLTPDYLRTISETSGIAYYSGDTKTTTQLEKHLQSLQTILIQTSNHAKIPLDLYGPTNQLIGRHIPVVRN